MRSLLTTYKTGHALESPEDFRRFQAKLVKRKPIVVNERTMFARVDHGRWIVDCECGSGNFVDLDNGVARCCHCGQVHTRVVLPDDLPQIESALASRPDETKRNWRPGDTVDYLIQENVQRFGLVVK